MKVNKELLEIYTPPQVFFLERYIEQLHRQTIDSYKIVRLQTKLDFF